MQRLDLRSRLINGFPTLGLVHQPFISIHDRLQVAESRSGYAGSTEAFSVERNSVWKEQLLELLALFE